MKKILSLMILLSIFSVCSCQKFLDVDPDNTWTEEDVLKNPRRAEGILMNAYNPLPKAWSWDEVATDDAVTNNFESAKLKVATGGWAADSNPFIQWTAAYNAIQYANLFLEKYVDVVNWYPKEPERTEAIRKRLKGEAYALRAYWHAQALRAHGGKSQDGQYLGVPYLYEFVNPAVAADKYRRLSYKETVKNILADIDQALSLLPARYEDGHTGDNAVVEDLVNGSFYDLRMCGDIMKCLKAQVLLTAASPAFAESGAATYADAAKAAGDFLKEMGGLDRLDASRLTFYAIPNDDIAKISQDVIWRTSVTLNQFGWEQTNFPPSVFGKGEINPTQNLVDAFGDKNGYPIDHASSIFNGENPYENRDPRLAKYIIYNGSKVKGKVIKTLDPNSDDGLNKTIYSTRTGYYMRKHLNEGVTLEPGKVRGQRRFTTQLRYTEIFLMYAEAANLAWGPTADPEGYGFSAYDVMKKLRATAGFVSDPYLDEVASDQKQFELFIRNERRIELCFEGKRFWDIRRWNDLDSMKESALGVLDELGNVGVVEPRSYQDYMIYGPIPRGDVRKGLVQNYGWN